MHEQGGGIAERPALRAAPKVKAARSHRIADELENPGAFSASCLRSIRCGCRNPNWTNTIRKASVIARQVCERTHIIASATKQNGVLRQKRERYVFCKEKRCCSRSNQSSSQGVHPLGAYTTLAGGEACLPRTRISWTQFAKSQRRT